MPPGQAVDSNVRIVDCGSGEVTCTDRNDLNRSKAGNRPWVLGAGDVAFSDDEVGVQVPPHAIMGPIRLGQPPGPSHSLLRKAGGGGGRITVRVNTGALGFVDGNSAPFDLLGQVSALKSAGEEQS